MNGTIPKFLDEKELNDSYYNTPNPYEDHPSCNVDLGALSNYAMKVGKKLVELTKQEVMQFAL